MEWRLFEGLSDAQRQSLAEATRRRTFARGEVLFHEGDAADSIHQIRSGAVAIRVTTQSGDLCMLDVLGPGETFGELGLLVTHRTRTATAMAVEPTETRALAYSSFDALRRADASVDRLMVRMLADHVDRLSHRLLEALYVSVERRVARRLLDLVEVYGDGTGAPVRIPLAQREIAELAGGSRPTVNEILGRLSHQGAVSLGRGQLEVLDRAVLERRAGR
ncbi:Crp/Fnr family transcriptional regulator [Nocardioides sp. GXQ0305]|uniref:Crp/Fnr family transcriptional regulator n=1 Tax=Nocardioides sp. GXQ0305 TaxID=3423912 RepID=UPI003D7DE369